MTDRRLPNPPPRPVAKAAEPPNYSRAQLELMLANSRLDLARARARDDAYAVKTLSEAIAKAEAVLK